MPTNVHNPDQYMASLRQIIAQGRKRIGLLVGAGLPANLPDGTGTGPLIPATAGLTTAVLAALAGKYGTVVDAIREDIKDANIEDILSRVRSLASVIGKTAVHGLDGDGHKELGTAICTEIGKIVDKELPAGQSVYSLLVSWISGVDRDHAVEVFTTNYDILFEQALERAKVPYFDGFVGAREPFFDPSSVANSDLPPRWVRLWKLHGSLGWDSNSQNEVIRRSGSHTTHLVFPEHLKYDQTQKAPYSALFDRLRAFLMMPDTLLIVSGFSFADAHVSACIDECLAANPSASVFAFQFKQIAEETHVCEIARRRANMSVYAPDEAVINGITAKWVPGTPPTRDWEPIRAGYWGIEGGSTTPQFLLGRSDRLAQFFAASRSDQSMSISLGAAATPGPSPAAPGAPSGTASPGTTVTPPGTMGTLL